ncbi:MAG: ATP-binding cassette domain-containing protein [Thermoproteus sp. AZ2]|jgi:simple sugar transport system ATP-binding protein|uniref:ATP-binding cassette domain-containing protein n=1 Tax=Thermoproteus sp. AZ2 TaxID=1609232 RepID=A0ACC6V360_9CREN
MPIPPDAGILVVNDLRKYFGAVKALDGVSLYVRKGEVVALLGDNGAGKSTFVKTVVGYHQPDGGKIYFEGREVRFRSPLEARMAGIEVVYQELYLIPDLPVYLNIFLAREVAGRLGWLDRKK